MLEIIAAFNLFHGAIGLGPLPKQLRVDESDDDTYDERTFEANADERLKKNNKEMIALNSRLASLTKELFEICQIPIFNEDVFSEEGVGGGHEEVVGGAAEDVFNEGVGGCHEEAVGGAAEQVFNEEGVGGGDEEVRGGVEEDRTSVFNEGVIGDEEPGNEVQNVVEIVDDGIAGEESLLPLFIVPLHAIVGDARANVNGDQLYIVVSVRDRPQRIVCEIIGQTLSTTSIHTLAPYKYVDNMLVLFATTILMHFEKRTTGVVKRIFFSLLFAELIINDYRKFPKDRRVFTLYNYNSCLRAEHFGLEDIPTLFLPFCYDYHWWCYVVKVSTLDIYVIDSLGKGVKDRKRIDTAVAQNLARFFCILYDRPEGSIGPLSVVQANNSSQLNL